MSGTNDQAPQGAPPQSHKHTNAPGMTNGVPDGLADGDASGSPTSDRSRTEIAGGSKTKADDTAGNARPNHGG